jgi:ankyrin repeat protein
VPFRSLLRIFGRALSVMLVAGCTRPDPPTIPFYLALQRADLDQIERHILHGAELDAEDPDGRRPLHVAAATGKLVVAEMLLKHGADIEAPDARGHSALYVALLEGRTQIAQMLIDRGADFRPDQLLREVTEGGISDRDVVDFLVRRGADINHRGRDGNTPLIIAIERDDRLMTKLLVSRGADVNRPDAAGRRPLTVATGVGNQAIIRLLRHNGAIDGNNP